MADDPLEARYCPAALEALAHFPVEPESISLAAHSENVTFRVSARGSETDYALRLHRPGYNSIEELESERTWMAALKDAGLCVQDALETRRGGHFKLIDIQASSEQRYAGMTSWLEGPILADHLAACPDRRKRQGFFRRLGEIAAAIHQKATDWQEPPGFKRRRLDIEGLLGEAPLWGRFWEHIALNDAEAALIQRARHRLRDVLHDYGIRSDNFSMIHADLHPSNLVYVGDDLGVIDFDDCGYGWHMYELASALIEDRFAPDFAALRAALLDGYRSRRPLARRDADMLPSFLLLRGMAIIGWYHQRPEHADTDYFDEVKAMVVEGCETLLSDRALS